MNTENQVVLTQNDVPGIKYGDHLKGVEVVGEVKITAQNKQSFYFKSPYDDKMLNSLNRWKSYLKSLGKSYTKLILDINELSITDLPLCSICNKKHVRISGENIKYISLTDPVVHEICSDLRCAGSYRSFKISKNIGKDGLRILAINRAKKALDNGTHTSQTMTSEDRSNAAKKAYQTALKNGRTIHTLSDAKKSEKKY